MAESDICRNLTEALDLTTPKSMLDDMQFPPVTVGRAN